MVILQTKGLSKVYGTGETAVHALENANLSVEKGEFLAIVGTSGSGKSTLLHLLGGLDRPTSGIVTVDGTDIYSLKDEALTIFRRRKIGFVFQSYNLVPVLNVYENIVLPVELDGEKPDSTYIDSVIGTLGLKEKIDFLPNNLSGGQQQRVAIARAMVAKPAIILAVSFGFALMITEVAIGRKTGKSAIVAFSALDKRFGFNGLLAFIIPVIIVPYYGVYRWCRLLLKA